MIHNASKPESDWPAAVLMAEKEMLKFGYCTFHQPRQGGMSMWLDLDPTRGVVVSKGRESVGYKIPSLAHAKGVTALGRK